MRRTARVCLLSLGLGFVVSSLACKQELDDKPAADPLEDPWVNSIDEGEPAPVVVAAPAAGTPAPAPALALADPALPSSAVLAEPTAVPTSDAGTPSPLPGASPTAKSASVPGSSAAKVDPAAPAGEVVPAAPDALPPASEPAAIEPAPAPTAEPAAAQPAVAELTIADFDGSYRYSGGSAQRADLDQAIEDAVMQLAMPIRGIGRKRLTNTNPIDSTLDIEIDGDQVQTIFESGFDAECTIDGGTVKWTSKKGDKYKVRVRKKNTKLVQIIEGEDGVKTTVFVLSSDKKSLTVHHKIEADRLDTPMTYKLSYQRK